jgi:hypothetical protein
VSDRYPDGFFDRLEEVALGSAREIVPALIELVKPGSVVDLGCARGAWLRVFQENGVDDVVREDVLPRYDTLRRELERTEQGQLDRIHPSLYLRRTQLSTRKLVRLLRRDLPRALPAARIDALGASHDF